MKRTLAGIVVFIITLDALLIAAALILKRRTPSMGDETSDELALAAILDGIDLESEATSFRGGSAQTFMGGIRIDLSDAQLDPAGARLHLKAVLGGIQLHVPEDWSVRVTESRAIAGGTDHPFDDLDYTGEPALDLEIEAMFGGVQVVTGPSGAAFAEAPA